MTDVPAESPRFANISSKAYEHPADRAATAALQSVPMLNTVVRKLIEFQYERAVRQLYLANSVKLGERQMPRVWTRYRHVLHVLDMPAVYDLYATQDADVNAATIGSGTPMIVLRSGLVSLLDDEELEVVLGHEVAHVLSDHVLYRTALDILLRAVGTGGRLPSLLGLPLRAVLSVLLEWYRAAELSCDRAATLVVRDPRPVCRTLMVMAAGVPSRELNLDAFMAQAMEYESWTDPHDRVRRFFLEIGATHAYSVRRVSEVMRWVQSGEYDRIVRGEYLTRDQDVDVRQEAGDAFEYYSERFRSFFTEAAEGMNTLGQQVGDASQRVADWIRGGKGGGEE